MTKAELISEIATNSGVAKADVENVLNTFIKSVKDHNEKGDEVILRGFGRFGFKKHAKKVGRIVSRNTSITIPERLYPKFFPADEYRDLVNNSKQAWLGHAKKKVKNK